MENVSEALAAAVWQRIRFLAKSMIQYDSFVHLGENLMPKPGEAETFDSQSTKQEDVEKLGLEFLLLSLSHALENSNYRILALIATAREIDAASLGEKTGMAELLLQERLSGLQQSGFVEKNYDTAKYGVTAAGQQLTAWIHSINTALSQLISSELPAILSDEAE